MQQTLRFLIVLIFGCVTGAIAVGCVQNTSDDSKVATLYRNSPTPQPFMPETVAEPTASPAPTVTATAPPETAPLPLISQPVSPAPTATASPLAQPLVEMPTAPATSEQLMIPVVGISTKDLRDTYKDARSENRVHDAIDITAPAGTPIVAVTDGKLIEFFDSEKGGITIYQLSRDEKTVYYYAHLQRRADTINKGDFVKQGTLIGFVGDTGNAGVGNCHLHFAVSLIDDPKKIHNGAAVNPYPLLVAGKPASQR